MSPIQWCQILINLFLAITFVQSGLDKVIDRRGNLDWLKGHFASSPFKNVVPILLSILTLAEVSSGILCGLGIFGVFFVDLSNMKTVGPIVCSITLCMLFLGQRMAKDYAGAASLVPYFLVSIFGIYINAR